MKNPDASELKRELLFITDHQSNKQGPVILKQEKMLQYTA